VTELGAAAAAADPGGGWGRAGVLQGLTVGVVSPFIGGDYYGAVIAGVTQAVAAAGGRVVAVQSLDPGSYSSDTSGVPDFRLPVSWRRTAGFVVITGAVGRDYLLALRRAGKAVVLVGAEDQHAGCPAALSDNWSGVRAALDHLVGHGHRRIGFAGYLGVSDIQERYAAYRAGLAAHRLDDDPALLYLVEDNHETGGDAAAAAMVAAGMPSTAVIAGTDRNAIGVIRTLAAAGYAVPRDQAVVGFDDIPAARFQVPALSSVRQPLEGLGRLAVELLLGQLGGEPPPDRARRIATSFIARESCGCSRSALPADPDPTATARPPAARQLAARPPSRDRLVADLTALIPPAQLTRAGSVEPARVADAADAVLGLLREAAAGSVPAESRLKVVLERLYRLGAQPELVAEIAHLVRDFVDDLPPAEDRDAVRRLERCVQQLILVLSHTQARVQYEDITQLQSMMNTQYELNMELLRGHTHDPRQLDWLARTEARGGVLGLWHPDPSAGDGDGVGDDGLLGLAGTFRRDGPPPGHAERCLPVSEFPPDDLFDLADEAAGDIVFVVPVRSDSRDWGMLAAVAAIQATTPPGRELMNQSGAMLAVALDRDAMLRSLREQEERLRQAALYDHLTGLPNRTLFMDRLRQAVLATKRHPGTGFTVLFVDLDGFKSVNDRLGHAAGDELLIQVAKRISVDLRAADTAARFGGDEFLILLDATSKEEIDSVTRRLHASLTEPFDLSGHRVTISGSIGAADSREQDTVEDLLRAADAAMYRAKSNACR
jgi:diguanylate cyclase (GGDEF)-like protein